MPGKADNPDLSGTGLGRKGGMTNTVFHSAISWAEPFVSAAQGSRLSCQCCFLQRCRSRTARKIFWARIKMNKNRFRDLSQLQSA